MCTAAIRDKLLKNKGSGLGQLTSGGFAGGDLSGFVASKALLAGQRRKAARLPIVPLLGQSGEQANPAVKT